MGFFSGVTNAIGSVFKAGTKAAANWGKNAMLGGGAEGGKGSWLTTALSLAGRVGGSLLEKKTGGGDGWQPVDTSAGITAPSTGGYSMGTYKAGMARGADVRMKTVDADTLTAEWEYRLEKSLRKKNLFT